MNSNQILTRIKAIVKAKEPFAKVYLYGSRARGTQSSGSDWDVLILLNRERISFEAEEAITDPLYDLELDTGEVISPVIYSENEWNGKYAVTPFYANVVNERVQL